MNDLNRNEQENFSRKIRTLDLRRDLKWILIVWRQNYFLHFSTLCIQNVNKTGTKYVRIMKQTAF